MANIAHFTLPEDTPPMGPAIQQIGDVSLQYAGMIYPEFLPRDGGAKYLYFWLKTDHPTEFLTTLQKQEGTEQAVIVDRIHDTALLRYCLQDRHNIADEFRRETTELLSMEVRSGEQWHLRVLAKNYEALAEIRSKLAKLGNTVRLEEYGEYASPGEETPLNGLTETQRSTLKRANEQGYFNEPRETDLETLAAEEGVSPRALSSRIRSGIQNLVDSL